MIRGSFVQKLSAFTPIAIAFAIVSATIEAKGEPESFEPPWRAEVDAALAFFENGDAQGACCQKSYLTKSVNYLSDYKNCATARFRRQIRRRISEQPPAERRDYNGVRNGIPGRRTLLHD